MQQELRDVYPLLQIQLVGINERGQEPGNASATAGLTLPWLQDVDVNSDGRSDVFASWQVALRDVVILDGGNAKVGVYNLNTHNLAIAANYATLRQMLVDAAMASQMPWRNASRPLDVDNNGVIAPLDVLIVINRLNSEGTGPLPAPAAGLSPPPFYDTSGDNLVTALDALLVINYLNGAGSLATGEGESLVPITWASDEPRAWIPIRTDSLGLGELGIAPRASPKSAPGHGQTSEFTAVESWRVGVDLAFETDPPQEIPHPACVSGAGEPRELDAWWFPEGNVRLM